MLLWSSHRILYVVYHVQYTMRWSLITWLVVGAWEVTLRKLETASNNQAMIVIEKVLVVIALVLSTCLVKAVMVKSLVAWFHVSKYDEKIVESRLSSTSICLKFCRVLQELPNLVYDR
ncbi:hypothetical protein Bca52824_013003 [Brassica carinata]|uniref:Uncharacterized protein n=1 Tax=Brassica carinata TaxID=52824 RepID=A0A8X7VZJ0_BRACI|nr:hypothetical protein Bca52824_013003 [Brassica carinata]